MIGSVALLFVAYSNFLPTALSSDQVPDYVKNHFLREVIFGVTLAIWTIRVALLPADSSSWTTIAVVGSVVILPFWVASLFGWSVGGMEAVWGESIGPDAAYLLHGSQVVMFYAGLACLWFSSKDPPV